MNNEEHSIDNQISLTTDEIARARVGGQDFAQALEKASLFQTFLLTNAGSFSDMLQDIFIGDKPLFTDDYDSVLKYVRNIFPPERFEFIENKAVYDPILVKKIVSQNADIFEEILPKLGGTSDEELKEYLDKLAHPNYTDPQFDRRSYSEQLGRILGIPKQSMDEYIRFEHYMADFYPYICEVEQSDDFSKQEKQAIKKFRKHWGDGGVNDQEKEIVKKILLKKYPADFVDHYMKRTGIYYGAYQYMSTTDVGEDAIKGKQHFEAMLQASGIKETLKQPIMLKALGKSIRNIFTSKK